jgi:hypothetical protein
VSRARALPLTSVIGMSRHTVAVLCLGLLAAVTGLAMPGFSSAAFTSTTGNATSTVSAAVDWTPPSVTMQNPGSPVKDTVTVSATASDAQTGVKDVTIQYLAPGASSWVTVCTTNAAPYTCQWATKVLADGGYDLRATATDNAGYATTSDPVTVTVANNLLVVLGDPGDVVRGSVPLTTTVYNAGVLTYTVRVEYSVAGANSWKTLCTGLAQPYTCTWATTGFTNDYYDLRSSAISGNTTYTSAVVTDTLVDNLAPTVTMVDPGTPLAGVRTFEVTAADAHSGVAQVVVQYATTGTTTYKNLCTVTAPPYSCRVDTTTLLDGSYTFRAIATDVAGNATTSALVTNRLVDNTVSSVTMEDPGAFLTGTVTLAASANSTAGVTSVRIQRSPNGAATWTDVCTDTGAPYSCSWASGTVVDGLYDFRAILVDGTGKVTTSVTVAARRVDNSTLRGVNVQAANGTGVAGKLDAADTLTLTYSDRVNPATITSGWTGTAIPVSVRVRDGNLLGLGNSGDTLDVLRSGSPVNLGSVNLKADLLKTNRTVTFNATLTAGTATVNGVTVTTVTVQLGTVASGSGLRTTSTTPSMVWSPSAAATDLNGIACSTAPVTETGAADRDF